MKKELLSKVFMAMMMVLALSCSSSDDSNDESDSNEISNQDVQYENMLMGTSWVQDKEVTVSDDGKEYEHHYDGIITFGYNHEWYLINFLNKYNAYGEWEVENGVYDYHIKYTNNESAAALRANIAVCLFGWSKIKQLTDSKLVLGSCSEGNKSYAEFHKISYREGSKNGYDDNNSGGSGGSSGDKPYVTSFDFTATKSSITVKFMCSERPTSATVKYGTSSPSSTTSSSIAGKQVSATVSGLKSGTKYYFKCTVSNSYGSSTSDTFSAMTNY